jgi:hypothetical protein
MEPIATAVARAKTAYWLSKQRPSHGDQWHLVDSADRSALAGLTPASWWMADSFRAILPLAPNWTFAGDTTNSPINLPDAEGKLKSADSSGRWQCCWRSPTCSRGKKGELNAHSDLSAIEQVQQREA